MAITQVISDISPAATPSMGRDLFSTTAAQNVVDIVAMTAELNTWTSQVNAIVSGTAGDIASGINGATAKTTPVDADLMTLTDSAASWVLKKFSWANLKTTLGSTFAALAGSASQPFSCSTLNASGTVDVGIYSFTASSVGNAYNAYIGYTTNSGAAIKTNCPAGATTYFVATFMCGGVEKGSITTNGSATAYNTSSDYRLKENILPMVGALGTVMLLKPCTYVWKETGILGEGFIAHELAEIVPQCVTGEKDAVNKDGSPSYQSIDTSFLIGTLTAAIQELKRELDECKARIPKAYF